MLQHPKIEQFMLRRENQAVAFCCKLSSFIRADPTLSIMSIARMVAGDACQSLYFVWMLM